MGTIGVPHRGYGEGKEMMAKQRQDETESMPLASGFMRAKKERVPMGPAGAQEEESGSY